MGQARHLKGLCDGAYLVDLEQHGVGGPHLDALLNAHRIGGEQVIATDLDRHLAREPSVSLEIVLVQGILKDHKGVLFDHPLVELDQLVSRLVFG